MKKNRNLLSRLFVVLFLITFVYYFVQNKQNFEALLHLNLLGLIVVALGYVFVMYVNGIFIRVVIQPFGKEIGLNEAFKVSLLTSIGNYFGPFMGGLGIKALYLKKKIGLHYTDFISTIYGNYVIAFFVSSVLGLVSLIILNDYSNKPSYRLMLLFFLFTFLALGAVILNRKNTNLILKFERKFGPRTKFLKKLNKSWNQILSHPGLIKRLLFITFVNILLSFIINYVEFILIGVKLGFAELILYSVLGSFSSLISITPGALGVREGIYLFSSQVMGVSSTQILSVALIDRSVQFIVMASSWLFIGVLDRFNRERQNRINK